MGTVRAVVWSGSESLKKGPRCALSSVASMVGSPVKCQKGRFSCNGRRRIDWCARRGDKPHCIQIDSSRVSRPW
jgi:hypothetical protein